MNFSKISSSLLLFSATYLLFYAFACKPDTGIPIEKNNNCDFLINSLQERAAFSTHKPIYIVLCDFTSSLDTQSVGYVCDNIAKIFDHYYDTAIVKFYNVVNGSKPAFFESTGLSISDFSQIEEGEENDIKACLDDRKQEIKKALEKSIKIVAKERPSETYLIQCLQNAMSVIEKMDPKHLQNNKIFILSDMLESGYSQFGKLNLEDHSSAEDLQKVEMLRDTIGLTKFSKNIDLQVALYSKSSKDQNMVTGFWNVLFKKIGYREKVLFTSQLLLSN